MGTGQQVYLSVRVDICKILKWLKGEYEDFKELQEFLSDLEI